MFQRLYDDMRLMWSENYTSLLKFGNGKCNRIFEKFRKIDVFSIKNDNFSKISKLVFV